MLSNAETQIIESMKEFIKNNPEKAFDLSFSEEKDRYIIRVMLKCKHTEKGLPVVVCSDEIKKTVKMNTAFFFGIPPLSFFDELELTKSFNDKIDCFKIKLFRRGDKTRIEMECDYPFPRYYKDIGLQSIQILERIVPSVDRFLMIYDDYQKEANQKARRVKGCDIVVLSQYRNKRPII